MSDAEPEDQTDLPQINIDKLVGMITHVNVRTEKHGDADVTAVDLTVYCEKPANQGPEWDELHAELLDLQKAELKRADQGTLAAEEMTHLLKKVPFETEFVEHIAVMWVSNKQLARWPQATVHSFTRKPKAKLSGLQFKVSSVCTPDQGKAVLEVYNKQLVRFEIAPNRPGLFDDQPPPGEPEQPAQVTH